MIPTPKPARASTTRDTLRQLLESEGELPVPEPCNRVKDPDGNLPRCKNGLGSYICERCGRDVSKETGACSAIPRSQRWRMVFDTDEKGDDE